MSNFEVPQDNLIHKMMTLSVVWQYDKYRTDKLCPQDTFNAMKGSKYFQQ